MPTVLVVSKPVAPPWHDSTKNLVRDLIRHRRHFDYRILVPRGASTQGLEGGDVDPGPGGQLIAEPIYPSAGQFQPALWQNARVLERLLLPGDRASDLYHYLFAPNPLASSMARLVATLRPRPTVQTVASSPRSYDRAGWLCFGDRVVTLSRFNRRQLEAAGIAARRLCTIAPGVELPDLPGLDLRAHARQQVRRRHGLSAGPLLLYAGDLEFSSAARTVLDAAPGVLAAIPGAQLLYACRLKTSMARQAEAQLKADAARLGGGLAGRIHFENQIPDFLELLAAADVCLLPAEDLYAKMDLPLVVLEAMAREVPVVVADAGPIREAVAAEPDLDRCVPGLAVPPANPERLAAALIRLLADPAACRAMGVCARRVAERRYDRRHMARAYEDLYRDLLSGSPRRPEGD